MNRIKHILLIFLLPLFAIGQTRDLSLFRNFVDKTWSAQGKWNNGTEFKQEVSFHYDLDKAIVVSKSKGFVNKEQTKFGNRNHGVRQYDTATNTIKFWEFDIFGNVTEGNVYAEGKNVIYQYKYGDTTVTDMWEYVDASTYNFKVGSYKNGTWEEIYLETVFKEKN
ncbi:hypothetical protein [uncultured Psychroserpens sp.]|uniref:hypothetical protein n=1 Tax=uncultured Psychroserpens sp. TaxID=255436 RepID=UPI0026308DC6|nr:hypothetical protein [uncultured Psychroserpens sp.]